MSSRTGPIGLLLDESATDHCEQKGISMRKDLIDGFRWVSGSRVIFGEPRCTYGKGRICSHEGRGTCHSRYNPTKHCSIH